MTRGLTICPDCNVEYETVANEDYDEGVVQVLGQRCPDCDDERVVGILNYPDGSYEVYGPALHGDTCRYEIDANGIGVKKKCGAPADWRLQRVGGPVTGLCSEHMGAHYKVDGKIE